MLKFNNYVKTTNNSNYYEQQFSNAIANSVIDSTDVYLNGVPLNTAISDIITDINADQLAMQNVPLVNQNNSFTGSNTFTNTTNNTGAYALTSNTSHSVGRNSRNLHLVDTNTSNNKQSDFAIFSDADSGLSSLVASTSSGIDTGKISMGVYSTQPASVNVEPTKTSINSGSNYIEVGKTTGLLFNGDANFNNKLNVNTSIQHTPMPSFSVGDDANKSLNIIPNASAGAYNPIVPANSTVLYSFPMTQNPKMTLTVNSYTSNGVLIEPSKITLGAGGTNQLPSSNIIIDGSANTITLSKNPLVSTYTEPQGDNELTPKKFVLDSLNNVLNGSTTFAAQKIRSVNTDTNGLPLLRLYNDGDQTYVQNLKFWTKSNPILNPIISNNGEDMSITFDRFQTGSLSQNNYAVLNICPISQSPIGIKMTDQQMNLYGNTLFNTVPKLTSDLTSSITDNLHLVNKKYVDNKIANTLSTTYSWGLHTKLFDTGDSNYPYGLLAPNIGTKTVSNSTTQTPIDYFKPPLIYLNTPPSLSNSSTGLENVMIEVYYYYNLGYSIPTTGVVSTVNNGSATSTNGIKRNSPFTDDELKVPASGLVNSMSIFNVMMMPGATTTTPSRLNVNQTYATTAIWTGSSNNNTNYNSTPKVFTNNYGTTSVQMKYFPINFTYINRNKIAVQFGYPDQANNPCTAYWISNLGYSVRICTGTNSASGDSWYISSS